MTSIHLPPHVSSQHFVSLDEVADLLGLARMLHGMLGNCVGWRPPVDWVIVGGESGHGARPFDTAWAEDIVAQAAHSDAQVFVKQLGANVIKHGVACPKSDKKGGNMAEWPETIRVREMPTALAA